MIIKEFRKKLLLDCFYTLVLVYFFVALLDNNLFLAGIFGYILMQKRK